GIEHDANHFGAGELQLGELKRIEMIAAEPGDFVDDWISAFRVFVEGFGQDDAAAKRFGNAGMANGILAHERRHDQAWLFEKLDPAGLLEIAWLDCLVEGEPNRWRFFGIEFNALRLAVEITGGIKRPFGRRAIVEDRLHEISPGGKFCERLGK